MTRRLRWMPRQDRQRLQKEIDIGHCFVVELGSGDLLRALKVVALLVVRQDGRQLVQLGHPCKLPGGHMNEGESSEEARERVLATLRPALTGETTWTQRKHEVVRSDSRKYGLPTEYVREIHTLAVSDDPEDQLSKNSSLVSESNITEAFRRLELIELDLNGPKKLAWLTDEQWSFARTPEGEAVVAQLTRTISFHTS